MKQTIFIISIFLTLNLFGQNLTDKVGKIEVKLITHHFKLNSDSELTKRKTNKRNRPHSIKYFDSTGLILKEVNFGKHHNSSLRLTDYIKVYTYSKGRLIKLLEYESDYEKIIYPNWKTKLTYDKKGNLIDDSTFYFENDSLFAKTTFQYDINSNKIKTNFNSKLAKEREFDSMNRLTSLKQIYEGRLRWEWNYTYLENKRIGIFQTHYKKGNDYTKKEITTFNRYHITTEIDEKYISKSGLNEKTKYYYYNNGIIKRIEHFQSYNEQEGYKMISFMEIKIKTKLKIDSQMAEKINKEIK
jgi:hypothetical protein